MPTIAFFYGIAIRMYLQDRAPPHFHAIYGGFEARVEIASGKVVDGRLPPNAERLVKEWALRYRDALMANWLRSQQDLPLQKVPGLDAE